MRFDDTTMRSRTGRVRYRGTPDKTWRVVGISNPAEGGTPFAAENFRNDGSDSVSGLRYTGTNFSSWVGRTCTFNMEVNPGSAAKKLKVTFASPAIVARSLYNQAVA